MLGRLTESVEHFALAAEYGGGHALSVGTHTEVHGPAWTAHVHWLLGHEDRALQYATAAIASPCRRQRPPARRRARLWRRHPPVPRGHDRAATHRRRAERAVRALL